MCLSAFLVLSPPGAPNTVLLGRIDPRADWGSIGALDPDRVTRVESGWMLPSCHLLLYESPEEAAHRIAKEQLGRPDLALGSPLVFSDATPRPKVSPDAMHWDIGFIFSAEWRPAPGASPGPWARLEPLDLSTLERSDLVRGQGDVLAYAGRALGRSTP